MITIYIIIFDSFIVAKPLALLGAAYIGLFEMGITFILWLKGLELSTNKTKSSTLAYLSPFMSFGFITLVLGEELLLSSVIGLALIISGISIQHFSKIRWIKFKNNQTV
jgi:drug/metabolite transporter (DMT)-like permease